MTKQTDTMTAAYTEAVTTSTDALENALTAAGYQVVRAPNNVKIVAGLMLSRWTEAALTYEPGTNPINHIASHI